MSTLRLDLERTIIGLQRGNAAMYEALQHLDDTATILRVQHKMADDHAAMREMLGWLTDAGFMQEWEDNIVQGQWEDLAEGLAYSEQRRRFMTPEQRAAHGQAQDAETRQHRLYLNGLAIRDVQ